MLKPETPTNATERATAVPGRSEWTLVTFGVALVVAMTFWLHAYRIPPNHDNAWLMVGASRLLAGGRFYYDIFEPNPPLIYLLLTPSAGIASLAGLQPYVAFSGWICILIVISTLLVSRPLFRAFDGTPRIWALALVVYAAILSLLPGYHFGQRDHLALIMFGPWLIRFGLRDAIAAESEFNVAIAVAIFAAVGVLIKPFMIVVPAAMIAARAISKRSWRVYIETDAIVFATVAMVYLASILTVFRPWLWVAQIAVPTYTMYDNPIPRAFWPVLRLLVTVAVVWEVAPISNQRRQFFRYLGLAAFLFFVCSVAQHKGWDYHLIPPLGGTTLIATLLVLSLIPLVWAGKLSRFSASVAAAGILVQCASVTFRFFASNLVTRSEFMNQPFAQAAAKLASARPFMVLATDEMEIFFTTVPLISAQWSSRTSTQWMLPGIVRLSTGTPLERARAEQMKELWIHQVDDDLERYQPSVVALQTPEGRGWHQLPDNFDLLDCLSTNDHFRRTWMNYHEVMSIKGWIFYGRSSASR